MSSREVVAAGAVVTRRGGQVLLVHRPRYDDWSFPKGKTDPGEHVTTAAVREVAEETGVDVRLGPPLPVQRYTVGSGGKRVHYWVGRAVGSDDVSGYRPNAEIDDVRWVEADKADRLLTYDRDRETLRAATRLRRKTRALVVLRHGRARSRRSWRGDDRERTLVRQGQLQAQRLVPVLAAFGVASVHTSSSRRCVDTVTPYAHTAGLDLVHHDVLSEEDATTDGVVDLVDDLREEGHLVVCTHRPVLPTVLDALGAPDAELEPGGLMVVHHRKGRIVATELQQRP